MEPRIASVFVLLAGCAGGGTTADSASEAPTRTVRYWVWEDDRECWAFRDVERPAEYWDAWYAKGCEDVVDTVFKDPFADADGLCVAWRGAYGECKILDPFILPCEAVPGCCDEERAAYGVSCFPEEWEP